MSPNAMCAGSRQTPRAGLERWFAVHCRAHCETKAAAHLRRQGYDVFLPLHHKVRRHARRVERVLRPFFPGYLFTQFDTEQARWRPINGTFGVVRIITQGDRPVPVPSGVIEELHAASDQQGVIAWQPALVPGQAVRVTDGPFAGLVGELESLEGADRVRMLLDLLGNEVPIRLPRSIVLPAHSLV